MTITKEIADLIMRAEKQAQLVSGPPFYDRITAALLREIVDCFSKQS